ncbi:MULTISPECIES: DUF397 domain-containing protein [unclassified Streptomyces]|uniref:DUF397 domain-containing protein n=1 Tax=unclassified Streptomyces TaxID=2593676 RepID=UPI002B1DDAFB|nr:MULTISPECIES: DUF397 domain-containing protein [unclassified Streptomyces]
MPAWQKSSSSSGDPSSDCIELAWGPSGSILCRESDTPDTVLTTAPIAWAALIRSTRIASFGPAEEAVIQAIADGILDRTGPTRSRTAAQTALIRTAPASPEGHVLSRALQELRIVREKPDARSPHPPAGADPGSPPDRPRPVGTVPAGRDGAAEGRGAHPRGTDGLTRPAPPVP